MYPRHNISKGTFPSSILAEIIPSLLGGAINKHLLQEKHVEIKSMP
jgi:hypothetical protein